MTRRRNLNMVRTCTYCGRVGTHAFTKNAAGHDMCQHDAACKRRIWTPASGESATFGTIEDHQ